MTPSRASAERPMYSERATRPASPIPRPDESSTAIVHRRPRGSQDASCSVPQGQSPTPRLGRITDGRGRRRAGRPKAGPAPGESAGWSRPRCARILPTTAGSSTVAMSRSRSPQRGQARTSRSNTRRIRAAQVHAPRGAGGAGAGLAFARMDVRDRAAVADAVRAPASMRGENAVIQNQVDRGARDDGRELLHELDRLEEQMRGSIAPDRLQRDEDAPVR